MQLCMPQNTAWTRSSPSLVALATAPMDLAGWPALSNGDSSWSPVPLPKYQSDQEDLNTIKKFSK